MAASLCNYRVHSETKKGEQRKINFENPCENEYKIYCLNGASYPWDQVTVGCNCSRYYGGKRCEKRMLWK